MRSIPRSFRLLADADEPAVFNGPWPIDRAEFEADLAVGRIVGRHWPSDLPDSIASGASLRRHRLSYRWNQARPVLGVISCNPSQATRRVLDPTLLATVNQADLWGFGGIDQANLSPVFMTNSLKLRDAIDLDDSENLAAIDLVLTNGTAWLAWGSRPGRLPPQLGRDWNVHEDAVLDLAMRKQAAGMRIVATRVNTGAGYRPPRHPSPRRIPPSKPPPLYERPLRVTIVRVR